MTSQDVYHLDHMGWGIDYRISRVVDVLRVDGRITNDDDLSLLTHVDKWPLFAQKSTSYRCVANGGTCWEWLTAAEWQDTESVYSVGVRYRLQTANNNRLDILIMPHYFLPSGDEADAEIEMTVQQVLHDLVNMLSIFLRKIEHPT